MEIRTNENLVHYFEVKISRFTAFDLNINLNSAGTASHAAAVTPLAVTSTTLTRNKLIRLMNDDGDAFSEFFILLESTLFPLRFKGQRVPCAAFLARSKIACL